MATVLTWTNKESHAMVIEFAFYYNEVLGELYFEEVIWDDTARPLKTTAVKIQFMLYFKSLC